MTLSHQARDLAQAELAAANSFLDKKEVRFVSGGVEQMGAPVSPTCDVEGVQSDHAHDRLVLVPRSRVHSRPPKITSRKQKGSPGGSPIRLRSVRPDTDSEPEQRLACASATDERSEPVEQEVEYVIAGVKYAITPGLAARHGQCIR